MTMIYTVINTKKIEDADVVILSVPYEKTTSSRKGTANGPKEIIKCLDGKLEFWDQRYKCEPNMILKTAHKSLGILSLLKPEKAFQKITKEYEKVLSQNKFIFLLGGEHSISLGAFKALSRNINPNEVTILQIDAHCDLRDNDSDYPHSKVSNLAHSCVMRRASEFGYNIVQVGIRTYSKEEFEYFSDSKNRITVFDWRKNIPTIEQIMDSIKTKYLYITIDVDGFDPAYMPATGTPVQGGLEWYYGLELIEKAIEEKELIGADIVEVSPIKDSVLTEYGAAQLCYTMIAHKFKNKLL